MFLAHTVKPDEKTKSETERNKTQKQEEKVFQHEQGGYIRILSYRKDQTAQEDKQEHILEHTFPYLKGMHFSSGEALLLNGWRKGRNITSV